MPISAIFALCCVKPGQALVKEAVILLNYAPFRCIFTHRNGEMKFLLAHQLGA